MSVPLASIPVSHSVWILAVAAAWTVLPAGSARAEVSTFLNPFFWDLAVAAVTPEPPQLVTFDAFTTDVVFEDALLDVGPFTFQTNIAGPFATGIVNRIDAPPFDNDAINNGVPINGTTYARVGVNNDLFGRGDTTVSLLYDQSILAWSADFTAAANQELLDLALFTDPEAPPAVVSVPFNVGFFGVAVDATHAGITEVQFRSRLTLDRTEFFGLDNVRSVPIPEPAGLLVLGSLGFVGLVRRPGTRTR